MYIDYTSFPLWFFRSETFFKLRRRRIRFGIRIASAWCKRITRKNSNALFLLSIFCNKNKCFQKHLSSFHSFREKPIVNRRSESTKISDFRLFFFFLPTVDRVIRWISNYLIKYFYIYLFSLSSLPSFRLSLKKCRIKSRLR